MKPRPKSVQQVFSETWPDKTEKSQRRDYNSTLQHELDVYLAKDWQGKIQVRNYQNGLLEVDISNAAYKMRFNSIRLALMSHLRQTLPELITISDRVNPIKQAQTMQAKLAKQAKANKPKKPLSARTQLELKQTADSLPDNLKAAMQRLINTASGKGDS